jgi:hypothetical protein
MMEAGQNLQSFCNASETEKYPSWAMLTIHRNYFSDVAGKRNVSVDKNKQTDRISDIGTRNDRDQRAPGPSGDPGHIAGVPIADSSVADHLNKTIQAARFKGSHTIVAGISDAVAGTIVDLGIDWGGVETLQDMQTGLIGALGSLGFRLTK